MTEDQSPSVDDSELEDDGVLDASDSLDGCVGDDPLDRGISAPDTWSAAERFGTTLHEERTGESLDQLLAEEEPDIDPYGDDPSSRDTNRAGRLVADDEGAREDDEAELIGHDVGIDDGVAAAEELAVHVFDEDRTAD